MPVLDVAQVARIYGARTVLADVTFTLTSADRMGLVGANGSGKSTLGRILAGIEAPDRGAVVKRRGIRVEYLAQQPTFDGEPTAIEAVLGGLADWSDAKRRYEDATEAIEGGPAELEAELKKQADAAAAIERLGGWNRAHDAAAMLARLRIDTQDKRVTEMSGGERRRVDLARLLVARPDLAILDEPTNHLDVETIEWLETHLVHEQPGALLLITHDRYVLDRVVKRTAELSGGVLRIYDGGYGAYLEARAVREAHEARAEKNRQAVLRRELAWLRRGPAARTTKQKARTQRAESLIAMDGPERHRDVALHLDAARSGKTVLDLRDLTVELDGRTLIDDLTLSLTPGERIGIVGPNGCGKTTLLRTILGERAPSRGAVTLGKNARVSYLGQEREGLDGDQSVLDNVAGGRLSATVGKHTMDIRGYLERFLFDGDGQRQLVRTLSGGERARVLLAKQLLTPTNLLVLDEPTNDLDVGTLAALEEMLIEMAATCLVVTHDRWFLDRVATGILAFEGEGRVVMYPGGYSSYRSLRRQDRPARAEEGNAAGASARKARAKVSERPVKLTYGERLELEAIDDKIAAAEAEVASCEDTLADPSLYATGPEASAPVVAQLAAAREQLDRLMARWEALETKKAESVS